MQKNIVAFLIVAGLSVLATPTPATAKDKTGGKAVLVPAADLKWSDAPGSEGVKIAVVEGDSTKGPHHSFLKLPGGFSVPLHHHTANHYVEVISGTMVFVVDGQEHRLPAGSYFAFTGMKKHETRCEAGADCVLFVDARSRWDVVPESQAVSKK